MSDAGSNPVEQDLTNPSGEVVKTGGGLIPRISIHAFFNRPENRENLANACKDRRMVKVNCEIHEGSIITATDTFKEAPTPNLLIVEVPDDPQEVFTALQGLAEVCDPGTQVVLAGKLNDITAYREFMRHGISEYLVSPISPVQFIEMLAVLYADPASQPKARVHCFVGAKGGVGSSTIAHNVAWCIAERLMQDTILLDFDLAFGTTGLDFNLELNGKGIAEALLDPNRLDDVLLTRLVMKATDRLQLFTAPANLESGFDPAPKAIEKILDVVKANFAHVVIDLPHTWGNWARTVLTTSDEVLLTLQPDLVCLRNGKNIYDYLYSQRPNDVPPRVLLNMTEAPKRPEIPTKEFSDALGSPPSGIFTYDNLLFGTAANNGQMVVELDAKNKNSEMMLHLAEVITQRTTSNGATQKNLSPAAKFLALLKGQKG